jgi:hypothetical protein
VNTKLWLAGVVSLILAVSSWAGITYTAVSTSGPVKGGKTERTLVTSQTDGLNARIEFTETRDKSMAGNYLLTKDGGETLYLVNTKDKNYMKWDMDAMMQIAGQMMKMMKFSDPRSEALLDEAGEPVAGYPTRHYRFRTVYKMEMNMGFIKSASVVTNEEDLWTTTRITDLGMGAWLKKQQHKTGNSQIDALIKQQMEKTEGMPLKMVTLSTSTDSRGKSQVTKSTMEVTSIKEGAVPASAFKIPDGYEELKMEIPADEGEAGGSSDSAAPAIPFDKIFGGK